MRNIHTPVRETFIQSDNKIDTLGFNGHAFPLIGVLLTTVSLATTYTLALHEGHVKPFPDTDITHTGIKYPEYIVFRISFLIIGPIFLLNFQLLKNYLEITSVEITGQPDERLQNFGKLSLFSCISLCISTASMSDGGDMNWTLHTIGASSFFLISLYICLKASAVYRSLWHKKKHFCSIWSYQIKKYANFLVLILLVLQIMTSFKVIDIGSAVEWFATFFLIIFMFTLYWDFKKMRIDFTRA